MVCVSEAAPTFSTFGLVNGIIDIFIPNDEVQGYLLAMAGSLCLLAPSMFKTPAQHLPHGLFHESHERCIFEAHHSLLEVTGPKEGKTNRNEYKLTMPPPFFFFLGGGGAGSLETVFL